MDDFRDLFAEADATIREHLGDDIEIAGRLVRGYFSEPTTGSKLGKSKTLLTQPVIEIPDADAAAVQKGAVVTIKGRPNTYRVLGLPEPDGTGMSAVSLRRES